MKLFDVDSEDDLPEVHQKAVEANKKGHRLVLDIWEVDGEKPSSDRVDEIRTALEEGEYTVPPLEEFEQALP
jgi:anti-sigma28 factor (negative regulator of flagellin synthesis)